MIRRLRRGQAEERDRRLAEILVERGALTPEESREMRRSCDPGGLGEMLVRIARLSPPQLAALQREASVREIVAAGQEQEVPEEVREALQNTLARVGKYALIRVLGKGGMGEVWKAWDTHLHRWVALKFLKEDHPEVVKRFVREAHLASKLSHPGITRVYEIGPRPDKPYIALEFVNGRSLEGSKRERRRAAEIVRSAARAVQHAHEQGVLHRDLKPANLLEALDGRILVTDFGLARTIDKGGSLTSEGALLGTPSFMAPEQAATRPATVRTDVYCLGATLYSLLEGRAPFTGEDPYQILKKILDSEIPVQTAEDELSVVVRKAMEWDPLDRYASAADLAEDLDRFLQGEPIRARPLSRWHRAARLVRRHRWATSGLVLFLAVLVVGSVIAHRLIQKTRRQARIERAERELDYARRVLRDLDQIQGVETPDLASLERGLGRLEAHVRAALLHEPDYPPALYLLGVSLARRYEYARAEEVFTRTLGLRPDYHDARAQRGLARLSQLSQLPIRVVHQGGFRAEFSPYPEPELARVRSASQDFDALPSDHPDREMTRGFVALLLGRVEEARGILRRVTGSSSFRAEAHLLLAISELVGGDPKLAESAASRASDLGLKHARVLGTLAYARAAQGRFEDAAGDAALALEKEATWSSLRRLRSAWLLDLGRHEEAVLECTRLIAEPPERADDYRNRSLAFAALRRLEEAIRDARRSCELAPEDPWCHWNLGQQYSALAMELASNGQEEAALQQMHHAEEAYGRMVTAAPTLPAAYVERGKARAVLGRFREALDDLKKAVSLDPKLEPKVRSLMETCKRNLPP